MPMFRYSRAQQHRLRQFYQLGCEMFGEIDPMKLLAALGSAQCRRDSVASSQSAQKRDDFATDVPRTCHGLAIKSHSLATDLPRTCHGFATGQPRVLSSRAYLLPRTCHGLAVLLLAEGSFFGPADFGNRTGRSLTGGHSAIRLRRLVRLAARKVHRRPCHHEPNGLGPPGVSAAHVYVLRQPRRHSASQLARRAPCITSHRELEARGLF